MTCVELTDGMVDRAARANLAFVLVVQGCDGRGWDAQSEEEKELHRARAEWVLRAALFGTEKTP